MGERGSNLLGFHRSARLIFSQSTQTLDILQDFLGLRGFTYERLDGSVGTLVLTHIMEREL